MHVLVNGVRLYFDVEGSGLVPDGATMRARPTLILLHGGPGFDHSHYKPAFSQLADVAQLVYLDHRGNGRSEHGPETLWTLKQWADDVRAFCDAVGIERPIVYGASFGGMVAMMYATRHPDHPAKLVLASTDAKGGSYAEAKVAMFERLGGPEAGALARRRFIDGETGPELLADWLRIAFPLYTRTPQDPDMVARAIRNPRATLSFNRPGGDARTFDLLPALSRIRCPVLLLGGTLDPMTPIECQRAIAAALPRDLLRYREFDGCGHGVVGDAPAEAMAEIRAFIAT
ncbi:MAG TPA: alpha/beta hydrolase [Casimicrobiaceae bacterium]|nr:alpha/beta hydrolase [Casimicrobiaceae bacterium]